MLQTKEELEKRSEVESKKQAKKSNTNQNGSSQGDKKEAKDPPAAEKETDGGEASKPSDTTQVEEKANEASIPATESSDKSEEE